MKQDICNAISSKKVINFFYKGGNRIVEPYCYGISTANNEVLRGYQIAGYSESGQTTGWNLYDVTKIQSMSITSDSFSGNRQYYNPNDKAMIKYFCRV